MVLSLVTQILRFLCRHLSIKGPIRHKLPAAKNHEFLVSLRINMTYFFLLMLSNTPNHLILLKFLIIPPAASGLNVVENCSCWPWDSNKSSSSCCDSSAQLNISHKVYSKKNTRIVSNPGPLVAYHFGRRFKRWQNAVHFLLVRKEPQLPWDNTLTLIA